MSELAKKLKIIAAEKVVYGNEGLRLIIPSLSYFPLSEKQALPIMRRF